MKIMVTPIMLIGLTISAALIKLEGTLAFAQDYPARAITVIVPHAAGASTDTLCRIIARKLSESWEQQVVVDNRPGAGGNIGMGSAAKAAPDGYTLVIGSLGTLAIGPNLYRKVPFDPVRDFMPITALATLPLVLTVHPSIPSNSVMELVAFARAQPNRLNYGSGGNGSIGHISAEMFKTATGINIFHVPYRGGTPALIDLVSGQLAVLFAGIPIALPHMGSGKLKVLAITSAKRSPMLPELPTIGEAGVPGFEFSFWLGLVAPAVTPSQIINRLNKELVRIMNLPDIKEQFASLGADPLGNSPDDFGTLIRNEIRKYARVVTEAGMRLD